MKMHQSGSSSTTLQLGTEDLATGEDIRVSSSFWELYDDSGAAESAPVGPEPATTQSSRHGFLAGESSWSNRASTIQSQDRVASGAGGGRGRPGKGRHVVRNPSMEDAMMRAAAADQT